MCKRMRSIIGASATAAAVATLLIGAPTSAQAAARDGICDPGEFCYYYNSGNKGSVSDLPSSLANYGSKQPSCYEFKSAGNGKGRCIKNDAASVWNRTGKTVYVYFNSNYGGSSQSFANNAKGNLNSTLKNNNASHSTSAPTPGKVYVGDDYPYRGQRGFDPWKFYKGQCTSFAAWAVRSRVGVPFHNFYKGRQWGNAKQWDDTARAVGVPTGSTPKVGAVAVRNSGKYGHVAFVTKVNGNGTFEVDEYNYKRESYTHRAAKKGTGSSDFDTFIYFK